MKFNNLFFILAVSVVLFSCGGSDNSEPVVDAANQSMLDDEALIDYLQSHYLNDDGGIWTIANGESPLMNDDRLSVQNITKDDVSYKLYYLKQNEGNTNSPSRADSVLVTYTGILLDSTVFDSRSSLTWLTLTGVIDGWSYGFTNFKGGNKILNEEDESFYYKNSGKGMLFIPSGLAYGAIGQNLILPNTPLVFQITLNDVNESDDDHDGISSILEDIDHDGDVRNDDTDEDFIPNYLDSDDDNDGTLTKDEDTNENGNWLDDDTDNDGTPDYLDADNS